MVNLDNNDNNIGVIGTTLSIVTNIIAYLDRTTVTFVLGSVVATLTIIYYILKIYHEYIKIKKDKK